MPDATDDATDDHAPAENTGSAEDNIGPAEDNFGPAEDNIGPAEDNIGPASAAELDALATQLGVCVDDLTAAIALSSSTAGLPHDTSSWCRTDSSSAAVDGFRLDTDAEIARALELEEQQSSSVPSEGRNNRGQDFIPDKAQLDLNTLLNLNSIDKSKAEPFVPTNQDRIEDLNCRRTINWTRDSLRSRNLADLWLTPFDPWVHFDEPSGSVVARYEEKMRTVMTPLPGRDKEKLFQIIFGSPTDGAVDRKAVTRWLRHAVIFANSDLCPWGLLQLTGGPCGVLAGLQSYVLQRLLYHRGDHRDLKGNTALINMELLKISFVQAITLLVRQATPTGKPFTVAWVAPLRANTAQCGSRLAELALGDTYRESDRGSSWTDMIPELTVLKRTMINAEELERFVFRYYSLLFCAPRSCGLISLVASLVLTRGFDQITQDFEGDFSDRALIGTFGHCNQEIVNLMLSGRASSNPFDGDKSLGSEDDMCVLKGIPRRCLTGYLSEMEVNRYCEVGEYLKTPYFPIWVVGTNEHFTVLFTTDPNLTRSSKGEIAEMIGIEIFNQVDLDGDGIVEADAIGRLLALSEFKQDLKTEAQKSLCEPYGGAVIIRADFVQFYIKHKSESVRYLNAIEADELLTGASSTGSSIDQTDNFNSPTTKFPLIHYDMRVQTRLEQEPFDQCRPQSSAMACPVTSPPLVNLFTLQLYEHGSENNCNKLHKILSTRWRNQPIRLVRLQPAETEKFLLQSTRWRPSPPS